MRLKSKIIFFLCFMLFIACEGKNDYSCNDIQVIEIENKWYDLNGGLEKISITDTTSIKYICERLQNLPLKNQHTPISYNNGRIDIVINRRVYNLVITVNNGNLYRSADGTFVKDDSLTDHIVKMLEIKNLRRDKK